MVVIARALLFAACCAFAVAACSNPSADASNSSRTVLPQTRSTPAMAAGVVAPAATDVWLASEGGRGNCVVLACSACTATGGHRTTPTTLDGRPEGSGGNNGGGGGGMM